ncbi:hypothetical protein BKA70DRAFT_1324008 [Coprinopsis sp. MPI-PUGE-AT-0042]|nr:hypothetical protein BKA70DRAFT_1324008 [Coprinopsis sp. MPI-PUGE-AT-0042]
MKNLSHPAMSFALSDLDQTKITLFDLAGAKANQAYSPTTLRVRFGLNLKGIPFTTHWVELKDVQTIAPLIGAKPTIKLPDGGVMYTVPIIYDPSTGKVLADSLPIAEYLDAAYPALPPLIAPGALGLTRAAVYAVSKDIPNLYPFIVPTTINVITPASREYFRTTREAFFKSTLEDLAPKGEARESEWEKVKGMFEAFGSWYDGENLGGARKWITGEHATYPDLVIAAACMWLIRVLGEDSAEWKEIKEWQGGRWAKLLEDCSVYEGEY